MLFEQREAMFALGFTVFGHGHFLGMVAILRHVTSKTQDRQPEIMMELLQIRFALL